MKHAHPTPSGSTTRRLVAVATLAAMTTLAGCLGGRVPARELYRLSSPTPAASGVNGAHAGPIPGSIAISRYATPGIYGGRGIVFRVEETEYGVYPSREWAIPLADMLATLTEDVLRRDPLSSGPAVHDPPSRRHFTYLWQGSVVQFEEVVRGKDVFAVVQLEVRLVRATDDVVVWTGERRLERPVARPTMPAIVETLSSLADEVLALLVQDARLAAPRIAADSATVRP